MGESEMSAYQWSSCGECQNSAWGSGVGGVLLRETCEERAVALSQGIYTAFIISGGGHRSILPSLILPNPIPPPPTASYTGLRAVPFARCSLLPQEHGSQTQSYHQRVL